jgi:ribonuclease T2
MLCGCSAAADFDYYVLSLSWSPEYCSGRPGDNSQCGEGRRFGFVVHGLWPQYERGFPQNCGSSQVPRETIQRMLPLMPSPRLIQHEWDAHGTCSGLSQSNYFGKVEKARALVSIPEAYRQPLAHVEVRASDVKSKFAAANPRLGERAIRVVCKGRYLSEVRVCMTKDLDGRACSPSVRDTCPGGTVVMRPVR